MTPNEIPHELKPLLPLTPAVFFVLFALADGDTYGYAITQETTKLSNREFRLCPGTLYTTLQRLLDLGLIVEVQAIGTANQRNSRRRDYRLYRKGKLLLETELSRLDSIVRPAKRKKLVPRPAE
jgi:DNA-binding PadR family transcriptional regulator